MKRRTFALIPCALTGAFCLSAVPASAHSAESLRPSAVPHRAVVAPRVHRVRTPPPRVTVRAGDTLSGLGTRTHRSWIALATYNRIPNPDVIYPGQTLMIPPASYRPPPGTSYTAWKPLSRIVSDRPSSTAWAPSSPAKPQVSELLGSSSGGSSGPTGTWACIASHESGGNPSENTGNGFYGMYQFTMSIWLANGGTGNPADASAATQTAVAQRIQAQQGWGAWPVTSGMCGV